MAKLTCQLLLQFAPAFMLEFTCKFLLRVVFDLRYSKLQVLLGVHIKYICMRTVL